MAIAEPKSDTTDCTEGRFSLLDAVDGLSRESFEIPNVVGSWSVRDCLAHLVGWDAWFANAIERSADGIPIGPLPTEREINEAAPGDWVDRPIDDLLRMLVNIRARVAYQVSQFTDEERDQPSFEIEGEPYSLNQLIDGLIGHDMEHAGHIRTWRKTQGV